MDFDLDFGHIFLNSERIDELYTWHHLYEHVDSAFKYIDLDCG